MRRGPIGPVGWLFIAALAAPAVAKHLKPAFRKAGKLVEQAGRKIQEMAEREPDPPAKVEEPTATGPGTDDVAPTPNLDVNPDETTKVGAATADVEVTTASPTGQEELEAAEAAEIAAGDGATPVPPEGTVPPPGERKELEPDQPLNPKRGENTRED